MTDVATTQPAAPQGKPAIKSGPIPYSQRVDPASLFPAGNVPARGSFDYVRGVMAAAMVERGAMTADQARAELGGVPAPSAFDIPLPGDVQQRTAPAESGDAAAPAAGDGAQPATGEPGAVDPAGEPYTYDAVTASTAGNTLATALHEAAAEGLPGIGKVEADYYSRALRDALLAPPPTREQIAQANTDCAAVLRAKYGDKADKALADARAECKLLAQRIPQLAYWLEVTGAGSDPGIIMRLATRHNARQGRELAQRAGMR